MKHSETFQRKWLSYEPYPGEEPIRTEEIFVYKEELERQEIQQVGTLTEFLVQMDGIRPLEGVLVIGATNRIGVLDPGHYTPRPFRTDRGIIPAGSAGAVTNFPKRML